MEQMTLECCYWKNTCCRIHLHLSKETDCYYEVQNLKQIDCSPIVNHNHLLQYMAILIQWIRVMIVELKSDLVNTKERAHSVI